MTKVVKCAAIPTASADWTLERFADRVQKAANDSANYTVIGSSRDEVIDGLPDMATGSEHRFMTITFEWTDEYRTKE